jgi:TonB family protein
MYLFLELDRMLRCSWLGRWGCGLILIGAMAHGAKAQSSEDELRGRLVEKQLYLRGFWMSDKLEFDGAGNLKSKSDLGPFALCGIDVLRVEVAGNEIKIDGRRVGLVSDGGGRLERRPIRSTTVIWPSLRRDPTYKADEEISIKIHGNTSGNFDTALKAIFVDGLEELAGIVPRHWICYARGHFMKDSDATTAEEQVKKCVQGRSLAPKWKDGDSADLTSPKLIGGLAPHLPGIGAELGASGVSEVAFTVSDHGIPVGFQIVKAVGAGVDEALLQAIYEAKFEPGTRDGKTITADYDFSIRIDAPR